MKDLDKAKEWADYAKSSCTEYGRFDSLMSALSESPRILQLTLKELGISTVEDALKWCWKAEKADRRWMRDPGRLGL